MGSYLAEIICINAKKDEIMDCVKRFVDLPKNQNRKKVVEKAIESNKTILAIQTIFVEELTKKPSYNISGFVILDKEKKLLEDVCINKSTLEFGENIVTIEVLYAIMKATNRILTVKESLLKENKFIKNNSVYSYKNFKHIITPETLNQTTKARKNNIDVLYKNTTVEKILEMATEKLKIYIKSYIDTYRKQFQKKEDFTMKGAYIDDKLVGYCVIDEENSNIIALEVLKDLHNNGIGKKLIELATLPNKMYSGTIASSGVVFWHKNAVINNDKAYYSKSGKIDSANAVVDVKLNRDIDDLDTELY